MIRRSTTSESSDKRVFEIMCLYFCCNLMLGHLTRSCWLADGGIRFTRPIFFEWSILAEEILLMLGQSAHRPCLTASSLSLLLPSKIKSTNCHTFGKIWSSVWCSNFPRLSDPFNYRSLALALMLRRSLQSSCSLLARPYNFHYAASNSFAIDCIVNDSHYTHCCRKIPISNHLRWPQKRIHSFTIARIETTSRFLWTNKRMPITAELPANWPL